MSLTGHLLHRAASQAAEEAARKLNIDENMAAKLTHVAIAIILEGFRRRAAGPLGATAFGFSLRQYREDVLVDPRRLSDADIRARGEALIERALGRHDDRATTVLADLSEIELAHARSILAMTAPAVVSALSQAKLELNLSPGQLSGVLKSEAEQVDGVDPNLVKDILAWVFRPPFVARVIGALGDVLRIVPGLRRVAA